MSVARYVKKSDVDNVLNNMQKSFTPDKHEYFMGQLSTLYILDLLSPSEFAKWSEFLNGENYE